MSGITVNGTNIGSGPLLNANVNTNLIISAPDASSYTISVGDGNNQINVGDGNNILNLGSGNTQLTVGNGNNTITTGNGSNMITVLGGLFSGTDTIVGQDGTYDISDLGDASVSVQLAHSSALLTSNNDGTYTLTAPGLNVPDSTGQFTISNQQLRYSVGTTSYTFHFGTDSATLSITSSNTPPLVISLPASYDGIGAVFDPLTVATPAGGVGPYTYNVTGTNVSDPNITFHESSFTFAPPALGDYRVTATVTDSQGASATAVVNLQVHTIDLSHFSDNYTVDLDFTTLRQVAITDTTANTTPVDYALNGLTSVTILGANAVTTFDPNAVSGSSYRGAAGYNNALSYQNDASDTLTFVYNGSTESGTVSNGSKTDTISNIHHFSSNGNGSAFTLTDISNDIFNTYGGANSFTFTLVNGVTTDGGGNVFNLYNGGSDTFANLNTTIGDTIVTHSPYDLTFTGGAKITLEDDEGHTPLTGENIYLQDGIYNITFVNDGGGNTIDVQNNAILTLTGLNATIADTIKLENTGDTLTLIGGGAATLQKQDASVALSGDTIQLQSGNYTISVNNDGGNNIFNLLSGGGSDTFTGLNSQLGDTINTDAGGYTITLTDAGVITLQQSGGTVAFSNNAINLQGTNYQINLNNNGGNNTFNLTGPNSAFLVLDLKDTSVFNDTININNSGSTVALVGGGAVTFESGGGSTTFSGQNVWLDNNDYSAFQYNHTITINNDGGNNVFEINNPGGAPVSNITNTFTAINGGIGGDIFNLYASGYTLAFNNDVGGNIFNLRSGGGSDTFQGINAITSDTINVDASGYFLTFLGDTTITLQANTNGQFTGNVIHFMDGGTVNATVNQDGGTNVFNLGGANGNATFTNVYHDYFGISYTTDYSITLNNDAGGNTFDLKAMGGGKGGGGSSHIGTFSNAYQDIFSLSSGTNTLVFNNDRGGNTLDLTSASGTNSFSGIYQDILNLHPYMSYAITVSNDRGGNTFNLGHPSSGFFANQTETFSGITNDIFNLYNQNYTVVLNNNGGGNLFNLTSGGGTQTFQGVSNDTLNVDNNLYNIMLEGGGVLTLEQNAGLSTMNGQTIQLDGNAYNITLNNDGGNNIFNLSGTHVTDTFSGVRNDIFNLQNGTYYTLNMSGGGRETFTNTMGDLFNLTGFFDITLSNDGGGNTFNLQNGGNNTFENLNTIFANTINLNGNLSYTTTLLGGGNVIFENITSGTPLNHNTFALSGNYTMAIYNNGGGNTINLTGGGTDTFSVLNNANNASGDTINLDNNSYIIQLSSNVVNNTINGGTGADTFVLLGNTLGNNYIDAGTNNPNTVDFSQFSLGLNNTLNIDLMTHQAYLTNSSGIQLGYADTLLNFNNIIGANTTDPSTHQVIKLDNLATQINAGTGSHDTLDLSGLASAIDLTNHSVLWSNIENITLGNNQSLSLNAANIDQLTGNHSLMITSAANAASSITTAGGWTTANTQTTVNGHTYDVYTATLASTTETLLIDQNIGDKNRHIG